MKTKTTHKANSLELQKEIVGSLPIIQKYLDNIGLSVLLSKFINNQRYVDAIIILVKNIMTSPMALYRVKEWANNTDSSYVKRENTDDQVLARALDNLFEVDRATLNTQLVLTMIEKFGINMDTIFNDSTSINFYGAYKKQEKNAINLKRGHSKEHRSDLKQLVYNLCVTQDGAIPMYFKGYDGNQTDDKTHWETWLRVRGILNRSDFLYIADSKLCSEENMLKIDDSKGRFITILPKTRGETKIFNKQLFDSEIRWEYLLKRKSPRKKDVFDFIRVARGIFQSTEGFKIHWYCSSEKKRFDFEKREDKIELSIEEIHSLSDTNGKGRKPKTLKGIQTQVKLILKKHHTEGFIDYQIKADSNPIFKQIKRGRTSSDTTYRKIDKTKIKVVVRRNQNSIDKAKVMDGVFPIITNTKLTSKEVYLFYKGRARIEKRHAQLKSEFIVNSIFLKKNSRIESLLFVYFTAQLISSLIERDIKLAMKKVNLDAINILPESRATNTPTWSQIKRLFEYTGKQVLYERDTIIKVFADELNQGQKTVLELLKVSSNSYSI